MKHLNHYALAITSAALLCGSVTAQERTTPSQAQRELKAGDVHASHLIGAAVKNPAGDAIGEVTDLIVSSGADVRLAVISVGGVLGVGQKSIALPYDQFTVAPDGNTLFLSMTQDQLKQYPAFDPEGDDARAADRSADRVSTERAATSRQGAPEPNAARNTTAAAPAVRSSSAARNDNAQARTLKASEQPAKSLIGAPVVNGQNSKIGKIDDLIVTEGRATQAVLELGGGVAGIGSRMVTVPLDELTIKRDARDDRRREPDSVQTTLTVAQLKALPDFHY